MFGQKSRIISIVILLLVSIVISVFTYNLGTGALDNVFSSILSKPIQAVTVNSMLSQENSLIIITPSSTEFDTEEPLISFEGYCLPDKQLKVCSNDVFVGPDGSFSCIVSLQKGKNYIEITNGEVTFCYKINYDFCIIKDCSPNGDMSLNGGMLLELSVNALNGSELYTKIGDSVIKLSPASNEEDDNKFILYKGQYLVPDIPTGENNVREIIVFAKYANEKEEKNCGRLTILESNVSKYTVKSGEGEIVYPLVSGDNSVALLSPKEDHGIGNAVMCTVTENFAEVVPAATADDRNDPRYSPQLTGTVDYITGECKFDDQEYFILLSGTKIDKENVEAFSGYIMPMNTVSDIEADGSKLSLTMNWKVPFISEIKEQSYYVGHASRAFNVSEFTASYIDFCFKYTNAAQGNVSFESDIVSHTQWLDIGKDGTSTLRVFFKNKGVYYGYKAYYSSDNRLNIEFKHKPVKGNTLVVIDPGHGGKDCGAIGINGVFESQINMNVSNIIKQRLEKNGINVRFTHYDDNFYTLDQRQNFARSSGADLFVALHNNSTETPTLCGTEVYYYRAMSQPLAKNIHSRLVGAWQEVYADNSIMYDKIVPPDGGVRFYPFQVTRIEECPSVLVECGYLSHPVECEMMCNSEVQRKMAYAVADGIVDYLNSVY